MPQLDKETYIESFILLAVSANLLRGNSNIKVNVLKANVIKSLFNFFDTEYFLFNAELKKIKKLGSNCFNVLNK